MTRLKLDQFVEEAICDKYVVELKRRKVKCSWRHKPWPTLSIKKGMTIAILGQIN